MCVFIVYGLFFFECIVLGVGCLDLFMMFNFSFEEVDVVCFFGLYLFWQVLCGVEGSMMVLNVVNEVVVDVFLNGWLCFDCIYVVNL